MRVFDGLFADLHFTTLVAMEHPIPASTKKLGLICVAYATRKRARADGVGSKKTESNVAQVSRKVLIDS